MTRIPPLQGEGWVAEIRLLLLKWVVGWAAEIRSLPFKGRVGWGWVCQFIK
jgi:hypothetical protein